MKSITKKISLLLVLSAVLFLSSCLDSGEQSYIGNQEYSYITRDEASGTIYARTLSNYFITSPKISLLTPGTTAFLTFQVTEETERISIGENVNIYKVNLGGEPIEIDQTPLQSGSAPQVETPVFFESLMEPIYAENEYFGDRWLFPYTFKAKKGENFSVKFYRDSQSESENSTNNEVIIDVRLEKMGSAESGAAEKLEGNYITANMSVLRNILANDAGTDGKVNIKFRYYRADQPAELFTSNKFYSIRIAQKN